MNISGDEWNDGDINPIGITLMKQVMDSFLYTYLQISKQTI